MPELDAALAKAIAAKLSSPATELAVHLVRFSQTIVVSWLLGQAPHIQPVGHVLVCFHVDSMSNTGTGRSISASELQSPLGLANVLSTYRIRYASGLLVVGAQKCM